MLQEKDVFAERFVVERFAGSGGMGRVFQASDRLTGASVALKVMSDEGSAERFQREGRLLAELNHPGIVRYVAHGTSENLFYIAMEWVEGETLGARLRGVGLSDGEAVAVVRQLADALGVAHARGIVHRDIKPGNVILAAGDVSRVKLLDFGIAHLDDPTRAVTRTGLVLGTVGYMAPEQAKGAREIDSRADVFSLGALLFHCLAGRPPFSGGPSVAVLAKLVLEEAPRLSDQRLGIPAELDDLVARMLAKEPNQRPRDGAEVAQLLAAIPLEEISRSGVQATPGDALTGSEQRLVSVLLASGLGEDSHSEWGSIAFEAPDTVVEGSTRDGPPVPANSPAERVRELRRIAARHGARLEPLRSGSLAVMLSGGTGTGGSATDLAARAARCALEMRQLLPETPMALATGRGIVAGALPVGEAIERAAELLGRMHEEPGVRVDAVTSGLLEASFDVTNAEGVQILQRERPYFEAARRLLGKPTSTVGRERELGFVASSFEECCSEPVARALLVTGPAGIGKSRVRYEALRRLAERRPDAEVWIARGDPIGAGSPFGLLAQALRRIATIKEGEPLAESHDKLRRRVAKHVPPAERSRVATFLAEIARVPFAERGPELAAARLDPILMGDQMRRAWEDFVQAECRARPVLLVLEDLHWGDLPTVTYVDAALRFAKDSSFMVLAFARPEVVERFPNLWEKRDPVELRLTSLTKKAAEKLVREALGSIAPELVLRLVERADGNAFYLEELIRSVANGEDRLPDTVLAMVQSRLESLPDEARRVLRAASVFGGVFWDAGVHALLGTAQNDTETAEWLALLEKRELITEREQSGFPGTTERVFRHSLLREASYSMLTPEDRQRGHRLAGTWLEENGEPEALVLVQHFEEGGLFARALHWCRTAASEALEGNDLDAASRALVKAREFADQIGLADVELGKLELEDAEVRYWRADHPGANERARIALSLLEARTPEWYHAAAVHVSAGHRCGDIDAERRIARMLIDGGHADEPSVPALIACTRVAIAILQVGEYALADELFARFDAWAATLSNDKAAQSRWYAGLAARALYAGETHRYREMSKIAAELCLAAGDMRNSATHSHNIGHACLELGDYEESERALRETFRLAERVGLPNVAASAENNLGAALTRLGRITEARALLVDAIARLEKQADRRMEGGARNHFAELLLESGEAESALAAAEGAVRVLGVVPPLRIQALATRARAERALGRNSDALTTATEAYEALERIRSMGDGEAMVRLVYAEALAFHERLDEAKPVIQKARDRLLLRADAMPADVKDCFLQRVAEHKRTLDLWERWCGSAG